MCRFVWQYPRDPDVHPPCTTRLVVSCYVVLYYGNTAIPENLMSTHYKLPWFVSRVSSAPAHIRIFKGTGWSVLNLSSPLLSTMAHLYAL